MQSVEQQFIRPVLGVRPEQHGRVRIFEVCDWVRLAGEIVEIESPADDVPGRKDVDPLRAALGKRKQRLDRGGERFPRFGRVSLQRKQERGFVERAPEREQQPGTRLDPHIKYTVRNFYLTNTTTSRRRFSPR